MGPSSGLASLSTAGVLPLPRWPAAKPTPPIPEATATASNAAWGRFQKLCLFIFPPMRICHVTTPPGNPQTSGSIHWTRAGVDQPSRELITASTDDWGYFVALGNNAFADRVKNQLGDAMQVQLLHDLRAMSIHRVDAQFQKIRNILARVSFGHKLQNFTLPRGQQVIGIFRAGSLQLSHVVFQQDLADSGAEKRFAGRRRPDGTREVRLGGVLQKIHLGARFQRSQYVAFIGMHAEHYDLCLRQLFANLTA